MHISPTEQRIYQDRLALEGRVQLAVTCLDCCTSGSACEPCAPFDRAWGELHLPLITPYIPVHFTTLANAKAAYASSQT